VKLWNGLVEKTTLKNGCGFKDCVGGLGSLGHSKYFQNLKPDEAVRFTVVGDMKTWGNSTSASLSYACRAKGEDLSAKALAEVVLESRAPDSSDPGSLSYMQTYAAEVFVQCPANPDGGGTEVMLMMKNTGAYYSTFGCECARRAHVTSLVLLCPCMCTSLHDSARTSYYEAFFLCATLSILHA
jgi:hypothetical protein